MLSAILFAPGLCQADSLYVGYGQSEQVSTVNDRLIDFNPTGTTALLSLDITDNLSVSADVYTADETRAFSEPVSGEVEIDSWSVGVGYFWDNWSLSASYVDWQDDLLISARNNNLSQLEQSTESPSYSMQLGYDWQFDNWQVGTGMGLHYSDWESSEFRQQRDVDPVSAIDEGNSTFVSVDVSASHYLSLSEQRALLMGVNVRWNQLTDSESSAVSRNGRNISQISNRTIRNLINAQSALGSESYGQVIAYISWDIWADWVLDLNASFDFGGDESSSAWALNIGYMF